MKTNWSELIKEAQPFVDFLERGSFFSTRYEGVTEERLVLYDAKLARSYALDDSFDVFDDWQTVTDSSSVFPADFEWLRYIDVALRKNNFFGIESKEFHGVVNKWSTDESCLLIELMCRDIKIILNCYANGVFPKKWQDILDIYLHNGFPCGWNGRYPLGELVVFSNSD